MLYPTIFPPKNEPGLVLNLFLNFGKNPGSSSYKLGSYKKKACNVMNVVKNFSQK